MVQKNDYSALKNIYTILCMLLNNMMVLFAKIQYNPYNSLITHTCECFLGC